MCSVSMAGHLAVVNQLLEAGADALIRNAKGWAPAQSAAAGGHLDIVLRLVAAGACPRSKPELDVLRMLARKTSYKCVADHITLMAFPIMAYSLPGRHTSSACYCISNDSPLVMAHASAWARQVASAQDTHSTPQNPAPAGILLN